MKVCQNLDKVNWTRKWQPTPVPLPGKSHGQRSLVGYSPWGRKESDRTEQLHFHFDKTATKKLRHVRHFPHVISDFVTSAAVLNQ